MRRLKESVSEFCKISINSGLAKLRGLHLQKRKAYTKTEVPIMRPGKDSWKRREEEKRGKNFIEAKVT